MGSVCARLATAALASAGVATGLGYLAPWWPVADVPNHFAPLVLAVSLAGLALLSFTARDLPAYRCARIALGLGLALVAAINSASLLASLSTAVVAAQGPTRALIVVSFNVFGSTRYLDRAARWLRDQHADVIVLQEMTRTAREPMRLALAVAYPYVHDCNCNDIVIYSRQPWVAAGVAHSRAASIVLADAGR